MVLLLVNLLVLLVGMFMETIASLTILTPILLQVTNTIGIDPIHLGVILVLNLTIGMMTPPFGVGIYTVSTVGQVAPEKVLRQLIPLYLPLIAALLVITFFPSLTIWLPNFIIK
jgi:C4-dicarboxylate transporter DctM subunit